jgi:hypothetical protein
MGSFPKRFLKRDLSPKRFLNIEQIRGLAPRRGGGGVFYIYIYVYNPTHKIEAH